MSTDSESLSRWRTSSNPARRHSISTVSIVPPIASQDFKYSPQAGSCSVKPKRRQSIQESLHSLTKSVSSSFQKAMHLGGSNASLHEDGKSRLNKNFFRDVLSSHYKQPDLKVTKLSLHHVPNPDSNQVIYEAELFVKDSKGRKKFELLVKYQGHSPSSLRPHGGGAGDEVGSGEDEDRLSPLVSEKGEGHVDARESKKKRKTGENGLATFIEPCESNEDMIREYRGYAEVVEDMWNYLRQEKSISEPEQYLCLPLRYKDVNKSSKEKLSDLRESIEEKYDDDEERTEFTGDEILVLQDLFSAGYHSAQQERQDESGLDFNHSIMAISRLARFHAVSYAMRKEHKYDMTKKYDFLSEDPVFRPDNKSTFDKSTQSLCTRLFSIFQHSSPDLKSFSSYFMDCVKKLHEVQSDFVKPSEKFGVICHGDLWRQNVLFFYGSRNMECHTDCVDVRFEDLHRMRFASCVTDLLYFLFTTVDFDVRRDHMMDFLAVYHDHFSKTVTKLAPKVSIFSREELFLEFKSHLLYGFLEGLCLFSAVYESQLKRVDEESTSTGISDDEVCLRPRYTDYKDAITAMISDVIRLQLQGEATNQ